MLKDQLGKGKAEKVGTILDSLNVYELPNKTIPKDEEVKKSVIEYLKNDETK